jgi:hypothetical protein
MDKVSLERGELVPSLILRSSIPPYTKYFVLRTDLISSLEVRGDGGWWMVRCPARCLQRMISVALARSTVAQTLSPFLAVFRRRPSLAFMLVRPGQWPCMEEDRAGGRRRWRLLSA